MGETIRPAPDGGCVTRLGGHRVAIFALCLLFRGAAQRALAEASCGGRYELGDPAAITRARRDAGWLNGELSMLGWTHRSSPKV
jgi:hypothetical protein